LLVDNTVYSFGFQLSNGIPLVSFTDDQKDMELLFLAKYVNDLSEQDDMI
jgi:CTD small phosphatase-like protein 2